MFGTTAFPTSNKPIGASIEDGNGSCIAFGTMFFCQFNCTFLGSSIGFTFTRIVNNIVFSHDITI